MKIGQVLINLGQYTSYVYRREGWADKGAYIRMLEPLPNPKQHSPTTPRQHSEITVPYIVYVRSGPDGFVEPWCPAQSDLFADDWYAVI